MMKHGLAAAVAALLAAPAFAQAPAPTAADLAAQIDALQVQLRALQAEIERLRAAQPTPASPGPAPSAAKPADTVITTTKFSGSPRWGDSRGFTFRPRGRLHIDTGFVENPGDRIATKALGGSTRLRRARLGVEGTMADAFGYRFEVDFAGNVTQVIDAYIEYTGFEGVTVRPGQSFPFHSLETLTSTNDISFLERASPHETFGFVRRLGLSAEVEAGPLLFQAGAFAAPTNDATTNDERVLSGRIVFAPDLEGEERQLHFGASFNQRRFDSNALGFRYRSRPSTGLTSVRFIDTAQIAARGDRTIGLEAAASLGPLHLASEAQWLRVDGIAPGTGLTNGDSLGSNRPILGNPRFFAAYGEVGLSLTGEHRPLEGNWERVRVRRGLDKGGSGGWQVNARVDHVRLTDGGTSVSGGRQTALLGSVIWRPLDYVRFLLQGGRHWIEGGPFAATVRPDEAVVPADRGYTVDMVGLRSQVDF